MNNRIHTLPDSGTTPRPCILGMPGCTTEHDRPSGLPGGILCEGLVGAFECVDTADPVTVAAARWTGEDAVDGVPLVVLDAGHGRELTPAGARRLAAALLAGADRAEAA